MVGGPAVLARNFAVMTGVNAGLQCAIKKARGGVEDVKGAMAASFGAGAAFSVVSSLGAPAVLGAAAVTPVAILGDAVRTGAVFSLLQGAFYQLGNMMSGGGKGAVAATDLSYAHTRHMLVSLGLEKYEKNFARGLLNDATLPLLTDSALAEVKIPAGPRLRILHHVAAKRAEAEKAGGRGGGALGQLADCRLSLALPLRDF